MFSIGDLFWIRFVSNGTSQSMSIAPANDPETPTGTRDNTDSSISAAGWVGIFSFSADATVEVLAVGVGTNGVASPTEAPTPSVTPVAFTGTVSNQTYAVDSAITPLDLSGFFSGTETPFTYSVQTGTLPTGLSLNTSTGVISGTPTAVAAATSIVVRATDDATDTADTNSFTIEIEAAVTVVKGVRVRLYDNADDAAASITGIQCAWFDQPEPKDFLAPELVTSTASTDADGWLELDLDSATSLAVGAAGFLVAYKLDGTDAQDSPVFAGSLLIEDIA
jgi:hypothetical protein